MSLSSDSIVPSRVSERRTQPASALPGSMSSAWMPCSTSGASPPPAPNQTKNTSRSVPARHENSSNWRRWIA